MSEAHEGDGRTLQVRESPKKVPLDCPPQPFYALELAMKNHARYIKVPQDVAVVWFHWCLLRNGFHFFGGELTHCDTASEVLPPNLGWNGDRKAYVLKYGKGSMPYAVGLFVQGEQNTIVVCMTSLVKSLRLRLACCDFVKGLDLVEGTYESLTTLVESELIQPLATLPLATLPLSDAADLKKVEEQKSQPQSLLIVDSDDDEPKRTVGCCG